MDLQKILELHQKWLVDEECGEKADLRYADLRYANLTNANLTNANLTNADLTNANLTNANLTYANLTYANLTNAYLTYANLTNAYLRHANLTNADLRYANLTTADLDFSAWPLWCGTLNVTVDRKLSAQIAYHFCSLNSNDPEVLEFQKSLYKFANEFHRIGENNIKKFVIDTGE